MYLERNTHADLNQSGRRKYKFFYFKLKNVTSYFFLCTHVVLEYFEHGNLHKNSNKEWAFLAPLCSFLENVLLKISKFLMKAST